MHICNETIIKFSNKYSNENLRYIVLSRLWLKVRQRLVTFDMEINDLPK